jgi:hypothetical protein
LLFTVKFIVNPSSAILFIITPVLQSYFRAISSWDRSAVVGICFFVRLLYETCSCVLWFDCAAVAHPTQAFLQRLFISHGNYRFKVSEKLLRGERRLPLLFLIYIWFGYVQNHYVIVVILHWLTTWYGFYDIEIHSRKRM